MYSTNPLVFESCLVTYMWLVFVLLHVASEKYRSLNCWVKICRKEKISNNYSYGNIHPMSQLGPSDRVREWDPAVAFHWLLLSF